MGFDVNTYVIIYILVWLGMILRDLSSKETLLWAAKKHCITYVKLLVSVSSKEYSPQKAASQCCKAENIITEGAFARLQYLENDQTCCLKDARREYHSFNVWRKRKRSGQILVHLHTKIIPSWTGLNFLVHNDVSVSQGSIGYLLTFNSPATKMSAVSSFKNMLIVAQSRELSIRRVLA